MKNGKSILITLIMAALLPALTASAQSTQNGEHFQQALENGRQARKAFICGLRNTAAWLRTADPQTGLVPDRMGETLYTPA